MSKKVVLYQSKYGATKKYAQWLAQELDCDIVKTKLANIKDVLEYDTIILGGGIYANAISGISFIKGHMDELKDKKMIVFAVGAAPYNDDYIKQIKEHNLKNKLEGIPLYYCRGVLNEELLDVKDKLIINAFKKFLAKKDTSKMPSYQAETIESISQNQDWTDKKYIEPIIKLV